MCMYVNAVLNSYYIAACDIEQCEVSSLVTLQYVYGVLLTFTGI